MDQGDEGKAKYTYIKLRVEELTLSSNKTIKKDDKKIKQENKNLDNLDNDREFLLAIFGAFVFMIVLILGLGAYWSMKASYQRLIAVIDISQVL